jgi:imidazolonepropionase-like amidohydrolase
MFLFRGGSVLDAEAGILLEGHEVLVEGDRIKEVSDRPIKAPDASEIQLSGQVLMPGLIDAHVHVCLTELNIGSLKDLPSSYVVACSGRSMRAMLDRGFTTVRDNGGADWGIKEAVNAGLLVGPRLLIAGRVISQTGGHGDFRSRTVSGSEDCSCCSGLDLFAHVVDGAPAVLRAVRDELRKGADHIKIMISGGVASPHDPLESLQFTDEEIQAAVQAADGWGKYTAAHAYTAAAIRRGVQFGVRSIEHGNLIDEPTAKFVADRKAFIVPTLVTYDSMARRGRELGLSDRTLEKNRKVLEAGLRSLEICKAAGVELGFGTDLLGPLQEDQSREFLIRAEALSAVDVIRSATVTNARMVGLENEIGAIRTGAKADLLVIKGNPFRDLNLLQSQGKHISMIMKDGVFHR